MAVQNWKSLGKIVKPEAALHFNPNQTIQTKKYQKICGATLPLKGQGHEILFG